MTRTGIRNRLHEHFSYEYYLALLLTCCTRITSINGCFSFLVIKATMSIYMCTTIETCKGAPWHQEESPVFATLSFDSDINRRILDV